MTSDQNRALTASRIGVFAALYVVLSLVPISMFIGAPSFLGLSLIITPVIAIVLSPLEAMFASLFGGIIALYVAPAQAMFGPYSILLPVAGATLGSLVYHKKAKGALISASFLALAISAYLARNYPFPYFIVPHSAALVLALLTSFRKMTPFAVKIPLYAFVSTMLEQGMMMIFAVYLLGLPWEVFTGILPLMLYERIVGTVGATLVILALSKTELKRYFETKN